MGSVEWSRVARLQINDEVRSAIWAEPDWLLLPAHVNPVSMQQIEVLAAKVSASCVRPPHRFLPPIVPGKIVGVGLNYVSHAREVGISIPDRPLLFSKLSTSLIGDGEAICADEAVTRAVDWEVELAVVVGRTLRRASRAAALDAIFGYTVANDVSARDIQFAEVQWTRAKSLDTFCPLGPWIVPASRIDHRDVRLRARVNGMTMQDGSTSDMCFDVPTLLAFCSWSFTLHPGDVVLTGTPPGVGAFRSPPLYLKHGDIVEVEVDGIGVLTNPVRVSKHEETVAGDAIPGIGPKAAS